MTAAVAKALMALGKEMISKPAENRLKIETALISQMRSFGKKYPNAGYGTRFSLWLRAKLTKPYGSFGNGSAMRVSPCALAANSLQNALELAEISASRLRFLTEIGAPASAMRCLSAVRNTA